MFLFFIQCLSVSLSIAIGVVFIYFGCKAINRMFDGKDVPCGKIKVKNFVNDSSLVDVKLSDGHLLPDQKFLGFADFGTQKVPYEFKTWLVLESQTGRTFIKPGVVRAITEKKSQL